MRNFKFANHNSINNSSGACCRVHISASQPDRQCHWNTSLVSKKFYTSENRHFPGHTPSTIFTGTPTLVISDIDPLIEMLYRRGGGEIGFGLISDGT